MDDRHGGRSAYTVPRTTDMYEGGAAHGPTPDQYVQSAGFAASAAVATKTVTMTITPGTMAPVVAGAVVDYITDWGDGVNTVGTATNPAHTYAAAGPQSILVTKRVKSASGQVISLQSVTVAATTV